MVSQRSALPQMLLIESQTVGLARVHIVTLVPQNRASVWTAMSTKGFFVSACVRDIIHTKTLPLLARGVHRWLCCYLHVRFSHYVHEDKNLSHSRQEH